MFQLIISTIFIWIGVIFMIISAIGIIRLPDFYIRMSAITKAATLGVGFIATGIGIYFNELWIVTKVIAIIFFMILSSPVAAHVISRAASQHHIPFWKITNLNEFKSYQSKFRLKMKKGVKEAEKKNYEE
ncbi:MAG: monovalent cation/H(+) antiporter subunit G [Bacteroidota bacterium]|nr:monovalent cation/H(+) antiporter subunit G [Bacteroidota bacterium]